MPRSGIDVRARDLGVVIGTGAPGPWNAITDVPGVHVGMTTLVEGTGRLVVGSGPVRTGVTVVVPPRVPVFAGCHRLNGNGEMTGLEWVRESGLLTTPVAITNTHSVGVVRDALVAASRAVVGPDGSTATSAGFDWSLPVVAETWDGTLNDIDGFHVRSEHVLAALEGARDGPVPEGNAGGGTGMICHGFKGGTGTASRVLAKLHGGYVVGVLVQANHGARDRLSVGGVPVGRLIPYSLVPGPGNGAQEGAGSIIAVVATDAPLLPLHCRRLAQRVSLGVARVGGLGELSSGDLFLAFSTHSARAGGTQTRGTDPVRTLSVVTDRLLDPLCEAVVDATEEAIVNALVAAETMTGRDGVTAHRLPHDRLAALMAAWSALEARSSVETR